MEMVDEQVLCKGKTWLGDPDRIKDVDSLGCESELLEFICPLRKTCYRFVAQRDGRLLSSFFEKLPFDLELQNCSYYKFFS